MGVGAAELGYVQGVYNARSLLREDSTIQHRERAMRQVRECQGLTDLGNIPCFHNITLENFQSTVPKILSITPGDRQSQFTEESLREMKPLAQDY